MLHVLLTSRRTTPLDTSHDKFLNTPLIVVNNKNRFSATNTYKVIEKCWHFV